MDKFLHARLEFATFEHDPSRADQAFDADIGPNPEHLPLPTSARVLSAHAVDGAFKNLAGHAGSAAAARNSSRSVRAAFAAATANPEPSSAYMMLRLALTTILPC